MTDRERAVRKIEAARRRLERAQASVRGGRYAEAIALLDAAWAFEGMARLLLGSFMRSTEKRDDA